MATFQMKGRFAFPRYSYCITTIECNISFPELPNAENDLELAFTLEPPIERLPDHVWLRNWLSPSGQIVLAYRQQERNHWLRFPGLADFRISANAGEILGYPLAGIPQQTVRHLFLDQVLPRWLAHRGRVMLHASAVQLDRGAILFIGDSGAGKSTLAGNFHRAGYPAISDDCVWIRETAGQILAVPTYGGLRLWEDSLDVLFAAGKDVSPMAHYSAKKRVPLGESENREAQKAVPVLALIVLSAPEQAASPEVILEPLSRREAFIAVLKQTFQLDLNDLGRMRRHAEALGRIVPRLPAFRLSAPHDYNLLPLARQKIVDAVRSV